MRGGGGGGSGCGCGRGVWGGDGGPWIYRKPGLLVCPAYIQIDQTSKIKIWILREVLGRFLAAFLGSLFV